MTVWMLALSLLLVAVNAFFVSVEFSLIGSRTSRLEPMADNSDDGATIALEAVRDLQPQLAGAQLGITMASLGLGFVAEPAVSSVIESVIELFGEIPSGLLHTISFVLALAIVVTLHMVLGEMVPKNIALAGPERAARVLAPVHRVYVSTLRPAIWLLNAMSNATLRLFGREPVDELNTALTVNEFHTLIAGAHEEGVIEVAEHDLLAGALDFRARTAGSVMVPRSRMVSIVRSTPVAEIEDLVARSGHSRLPVEGTGPDDIVGFVHSKDLLRLPADARPEPPPLEIIRRMLIVPPDRSIRDLMRSMRRTRRHMALVRDSEGGLLGMVTLEDVLESLVGSIRDETDRPESAPQVGQDPGQGSGERRPSQA